MARILPQGNKPPPAEAATYVDQYEEFENEVSAIMSAAMLKAKKVRESQRELLDDAKSKGVAKKLIVGLVKIRSLNAKSQKVMDDFEDDVRDYGVNILKALGDFANLPLGQAAVKSAKDSGLTGAVVDAVRGQMTDEEWEAHGKKLQS